MTARRQPLVIAHRGASADHRENTVAAFLGAAEQGADWVELDVRPTAAGELVVHHDPVLPDGRSVWDLPEGERPAGLCPLDEALDACAGMGVNVEIKNSPGDLGEGVGRPAPHDLGLADRVLALLSARWDRGAAPGIDDVLVSSFDPPTLARVRTLASTVPTAALVMDLAAVPDLPERAAAAGHVALNPWDPFVDAELVARCRALGLAVYPWTVDDPARIVELAALGVDGIITNVPAVARELLSEL